MRIGRIAVLPIISIALLSGCGSEYWAPYSAETPSPSFDPSSPTDPGANVGPTAPVGAATLGVTIDDLPKLWNDAAATGGVELPDSISADDTFDGLSTASLIIGDTIVFIQWFDETGEINILEVEGAVNGSAVVGSVAANSTPSLAHAALGLSVAESEAFMSNFIKTSISNSADSAFISEVVEKGDATVSFNLSEGAMRFTVEPTLF